MPSREVTLVIENHSHQPLKLKRNQIVGHLIPAQPVQMMEEVNLGREDTVPIVAPIRSSSPDPAQIQQLLNAANIDEDNLIKSQQSALEDLIKANAGVFALNQTKL